MFMCYMVDEKSLSSVPQPFYETDMQFLSTSVYQAFRIVVYPVCHELGLF